MPNPDFTLLYVTSPAASQAFYAHLFGHEPVESSPTFVMFALPSGFKLGMWARDRIEPAAAGSPGSVELVFAVSDAAEVQRVHHQWRANGLPIAQPPTEMDFGTTFTALDPDGHRLRVFAAPQA
jgi:predicted enzyme related to lactoylglutathione lyase